MTNERSLAADMLDPNTQARAALEFSRLAPSNEAATWAIAAAVFSLRDTVAEAMNAKAAAPAVAEPDRSQLTPEEVAEIQRWRTPLPTAMADIGADALRFRHLRRTVEKNREGLLQADFAVMYPDEWTANVEDMREMWTAAIDRNMKGKLP